MISLQDVNENGVLSITASGKLTREDYIRVMPELERKLEKHGRLRFFIRLEDVTGMEAGAVWEDLKFDVRHMDKFGRTAIVGNRRWEEWGTKLSAPFFSPEVRFFYENKTDEAWEWVNG